MTRRFSVLCLALGTLTLPAAAQETQSQTYRCERGAQVPLDEAMGVMARVFGEVFEADVVDAA